MPGSAVCAVCGACPSQWMPASPAPPHSGKVVFISSIAGIRGVSDVLQCSHTPACTFCRPASQVQMNTCTALLLPLQVPARRWPMQVRSQGCHTTVPQIMSCMCPHGCCTAVGVLAWRWLLRQQLMHPSAPAPPAASKGALLPLARSLASAWGKDNIQVRRLLTDWGCEVWTGRVPPT